MTTEGAAFLPPDELLPCGCIIGNRIEKGEKIFFIKPCNRTCEYYQWAVAETRGQGKPVEYRARNRI